MEDYKLDINSFLDKSLTMPVIDVRSPAEFEHGHISDALNLPIFTNEERSIVGTMYIQKGSSEAIMKGLELIGPKMKEYAAKALQLAPENELLLHCWRGGMRSNSMAWLLNTVGIKAHALEGGYKSYRQFVRALFSNPLNLIVIGGMTGSGKTHVLEALASFGKQVIDLEGLAGHKGSAFGNIGLPSQLTTQQFENDLFTCLRQLNPEEPIYIEDESLSIGRIFIPEPFFKQMLSARFFNLIVPLHQRIKRLVETYSGCDNNDLIAGVKHIERRLGLENATKAIACINQDEMEEAVKIILQYYDKIYSHGSHIEKRKEITEIIVTQESIFEIAQKIINMTGNR
jgi:tRNA 2-selenouridine synthase